MKGVIDKNVVDVILKSTGEISKHHADKVGESVTASVDKKLKIVSDDIVDISESLESTSEKQNGFYSEIKELFLRLSAIKTSMKTLADDAKSENDLSFEAIKNDFDSIKNRIESLTQDILATVPQDTVEKLTVVVSAIDERLGSDESDNELLFKIVDNSFKAINDRVETLAQDALVADPKDAVEKLIIDVSAIDERINNNKSDNDLIFTNIESKFGVISEMLANFAKDILTSAQKDVVDELTADLSSIDKRLSGDVSDNVEALSLVSSNIVKLNEQLREIKYGSDENVNCLIEDIDEKVANLIASIDKAISDVNAENSKAAKSIEGLIVDIDKRLSETNEDVAGNDSALCERLESVNNNLTDVRISLSGEIKNEAESRTDEIISVRDDVAKINDNINDALSAVDERLNSSDKNLVEVNTDLSGEVASLAGEIKNENASRKNAISALLKDLNKINDDAARLKVSIVGCTDDIAEISNSFNKRLDLLNTSDDELNESLIKVNDLITELESNNSDLIDTLIKATGDITDQFNDLKTESFLSSDKIDMKFAEMSLSLVESDVKRGETFKEIIDVQCEIIKENLNDDFKEHRRNIGNQVEASNKLVVDNVDKIIATDKHLLARSKQWESGVEYGEGVITRNHGGIWQARSTTMDEPCADSDYWYCISSGIHKIETLKTHSNGVETIIGIYDSLGSVYELAVPTPGIRYLKGVYKPEVEYNNLDSIMKDGCRWVATKDLPEGVPGEDDADWQVLTMRGPKGMKGSTGERGPKGKTGENGIQGEQGKTGPRGIKGKHNLEYLYTKNMLSPMVTRKELDDLVKTPKNGQTVIVHSDMGIERYFRCEYIGEIDKWVTQLVNAV